MEIMLKPIRRQCFVPGCRNLNCHIVTKSREMPVSVILCDECIQKIHDLRFPPEAASETGNETGNETAAKPKTARKKA